MNRLAIAFARRTWAGRVWLIVCFIGCGSLATGCSGDTSPSSATVKLTAAQIAVITDTKGADVSFALAQNAVQTLIERCMRAKSLVYYPNFDSPAATATLASIVPGIPQASIGLATRMADGYGFYSKGVRQAAHPGAQSQFDTEDSYVASLMAGVRQQYLLALRGPFGQQATVTIPGAGTAQIAEGGCQAAARRQIYGSLANFIFATIGWSQMTNQLSAAVQADPAFLAVIGKWSACMSHHGYRYHSPEKLWDRLGTRITGRPTPAAYRLEISTAVQDYKCSQAVRLVPTIKALQANHVRYMSKSFAGNVARTTQIFARALKVARALHVTG